MQNQSSKKRFKKPTASLISMILVICVAVGGVLAILLTSTGTLKNIFDPSKVTTSVDETFDGEIKQNVSIKNTGNTDAWIRAAVVINWVDEEGNVYGVPPVEGTDYTITYDLANGWVKGDDGFYYWTKPVKSVEQAPKDCNTGVLIKTCSPTSPSSAPDGYTLSVEIVGSGIQSVPAKVFNNNWGESSGLKVDESKNVLSREG